MTPDAQHERKSKVLTCALKSFDVLGSLSKLSNGLHEGNSGLLVGFEWGEDGSGHCEWILRF